MMRCEDCGNQPKKDCSNRRCCNGKGFVCQTHVNSTWVPSYTRTSNINSSHLLPPPHRSIQKTKRRLTTSSLFSGMEVGLNFPAEVKTPSTFRCVRVGSMEMGEHYAYQTSVRIGGHVFKGILYDKGPEIISKRQPGTQLNFVTTTTSFAGTPGTPVNPASATNESQLFPYHFPFFRPPLL